MKRKISVSGACQSGGMIDALKLMLPADHISFLPVQASHPTEEFFDELSTADIWVTADWRYSTETNFSAVNSNLQIIKWPHVYFAAFHPDIALATAENHFITSFDCVFNSAICLWAWKTGVSVDDAVELFNSDTFAALGYLNSWSSSAKGLSAQFAECGLDFERFFFPVKRQGVFMHSHLHAKPSPIIHVARQIAANLGVEQSIIDAPLEDFLVDTLIFDSVWAVYPEIGESLGVKSSYMWKFRDHRCLGIRDFVERSYTGYNSQPINPALIKSDNFDFEFEMTMQRQRGAL